MSDVGPTGLGKVVLSLVIVGLLAAGGYFFKDKLMPSKKKPQAQQTDAKFGDSNSDTAPTAPMENPQDAPGGITTVSEYKYVAAQKLPPVKGVSNYMWDNNNKVVVFPINIWIGWLPIVAANGGFNPNENSVFFKKYGFKVNLKLIDDPVTARDSFAAGQSHALWGTLDMMVLFAPDLMKDSRTAPRIFQQIDWSNGGDGIVVRSTIKSVKDLVDKKVVFAQNSPSQYFINNILLQSGLQPGSIKPVYVQTAFEASAAFVSDKSIDACVSWAPDIYKIPEKVKNTKILTTTAEANKLIADVYALRADFAKDHPEIVEGLVTGIFEGMRMLKDDNSKAQAIQHMAEGFGLPADAVQGMIADAHITNFYENYNFFMNQNSPSNFERTWKNITYVYKELGLVGTPVRFDEVMDFSMIQKLKAENKFSDEKDENVASFAPVSYSKLTENLEQPILTQTIRINFYPNSVNIYEPQHDDLRNPIANTLYDPNVNATVEKVAKLSGQYDRAIIAVIGHADNSMKGKVPENEVRKLSMERAQAVANALIDKFKFPKEKFTVTGKGWDVPADAADPNNQTLNRRVEIAVYPVEQK